MSALHDIDDHALVDRARFGDRGAFAVLLERHYEALLASCARMIGDRELARDAAQEAAVRALLGIESLRDERRFAAWLIGIGLNVCRGWLTGSERRTRAIDPSFADSALPVPQGDETFELVAANQLASRVRAAIAELPAGQREAVVRFYLLGLTQAEIATELRTGSGAVKTRLNKARHALRESLKDTYEEHIKMSDEPLTDTTAGSDLVPVHVAGLRRTVPTAPGVERHIVFLEGGDGRRLLIWIGQAEATALALILEGIETPRPGVYQFAASLVEGAGRRIAEVRLTDLASGVFFAQVILDDGTTVDARPSDAITLALLTDAPISVRAAVLLAADRLGAERGDLLTEAESATDDQAVIAAETLARYQAILDELDTD